MPFIRLYRPSGITVYKNHFEMSVETLKEIYSDAGAALRRELMKTGGRPQTDNPRCPCGQMTLKRAKARAHKCDEHGPILSANKRGMNRWKK